MPSCRWNAPVEIYNFLKGDLYHYQGENALVPLKCSSRNLQFIENLQFPHRVPFTEEKMLWCPCPLKNEAYIVPARTGYQILSKKWRIRLPSYARSFSGASKIYTIITSIWDDLSSINVTSWELKCVKLPSVSGPMPLELQTVSLGLLSLVVNEF